MPSHKFLSRIMLSTIVLSLSVLTPITAHAVSAPLVQTDSRSISGAVIQATNKEITTTATSPFTSVTYKVDGKNVGSDSTIDYVNGKYVASVKVDLSSLPVGKRSFTAKIVNGKISSTVAKTFTLVQSPAPVKPSAATTGVPVGTVLTPYQGNMTITQDGTILSGLDINGCVLVFANNVTIEKSRIRCRANTLPYNKEVVRIKNASNLAIIDSEVDGMGDSQVGIGYGNFTATRVNVHHSIDGVRMGNDSKLTDSWVHDMYRDSNFHSDAVQLTGGNNASIERNNLDPRTASGDFLNSAIQVGSENAAMTQLKIADNWLDGGNCSLNISASVKTDQIQVLNNKFADHVRFAGCAIKMPLNMPDKIILQNNVLESTGAAVVPHDASVR